MSEILNRLTELADAHGAKALGDAMAALKGAIRRKRRDQRSAWGMLAETYREAMRIWDAQKAEGVSQRERIAGLEKTLRASWPQVREWKFVCDRCSDTGLEVFDCHGTHACGKTFCPYPHTYGVPCLCPKGARFVPKPVEADFKAAGKTGLTKVGK